MCRCHPKCEEHMGCFYGCRKPLVSIEWGNSSIAQTGLKKSPLTLKVLILPKKGFLSLDRWFLMSGVVRVTNVGRMAERAFVGSLKHENPKELGMAKGDLQTNTIQQLHNVHSRYQITSTTCVVYMCMYYSPVAVPLIVLR